MLHRTETICVSQRLQTSWYKTQALMQGIANVEFRPPLQFCPWWLTLSSEHAPYLQWLSKALKGPGSTVTWGPSVASAPRAEAGSPKCWERGWGFGESLLFSCIKFLWPHLGPPGAWGPRFIEPPEPLVSMPLPICISRLAIMWKHDVIHKTRST